MSDIKKGMKVRVFKGPFAGMEGTAVRVIGDYFAGGESKVVFEDFAGEEHSFGGTFIEPVVLREQGKQIRFEDVHVGDHIKVEFTEKDRRTIHFGVVNSNHRISGGIRLYTHEGSLLAAENLHYDQKITLLKAVREKHVLDDAEIGDNFTVFFASGGNTVYTFLRKDRWVRETYRLDGGLESSATEPAKRVKEFFDRHQTKLTKAVK